MLADGSQSSELLVRGFGLNVTLQCGQGRLFFFTPDDFSGTLARGLWPRDVERIRLGSTNRFFAAFQPAGWASPSEGNRRNPVEESAAGPPWSGSCSSEPSSVFSESSLAGGGNIGIIGSASWDGAGTGSKLCPSIASGCSDRGPNTGRVGTG